MDRIAAFFNAKSVALIGATDKEGATGRVILENILISKDKRKIYPVNPRREKVLELKCYPNVSALPEKPDLAVIVIPAELVIESVEDCGKAGVKSIIIVSAGFKEVGAEGKAREDKILELCRKYGIRVIGPNCMGTIKPAANLNTTFTKRMPKPGNVAFLSQSGALGSGVLDWAISKNLGFSAFASLGSMMDVNFGDLIDYFGADPDTRSIIIYLESIGDAKKFMSAARGFSRSKPIIVLKPGKFEESAKSARSHTGAMVGDDSYYDAVFRRAGAVRVEEVGDLFNCAAILDTAHLPKGPNLAIVTNAGGPAVLATDALISRGGKLANLSPDTINALNGVLPASWSKSNPVDILGDADPQRYVKALEATIKDPQVNGIIMIYTPQGSSNSVDIAKAVSDYVKKINKPVLSALIGEEEVNKARQIFYANKIPTYEFPEEAIKTYLYMYQYARNLEMLYETPEEISLSIEAPKNHLKILARKALQEKKTLLNEEDSKKFMGAYRIPVTLPLLARTVQDAVKLSSDMGYPVVMKIASPDISHKTDVGGVILNITSADEVKKAFREMMENVKKHEPKACIEGVTIQNMITNCDYELIVGCKKDVTFGPVILFGMGGVEAEFFKDISIGIPPLNQVLARRVLEQTRIYRVLSKGFRNKPPVKLRLLDETLVNISNLVVDFPEIKEIDINPLVVKGDSVIALDARIILDESYVPRGLQDHSHLIIAPYPNHYTTQWTCSDGRSILLRPIRPEDEALEKELLAGLSEESNRFRFFYILKDISHDILTRFCNIDYDREMAILAEYTVSGKRRNVGVGRLIMHTAGDSAEFATLVADDFHGLGLGLKLTDMLIGIAEERGIKTIYGIVSNENVRMLNLSRRLGFTIAKESPEESKVTLNIR